ncbi:MAG: ABC transporter substrate-binding protein [Acidimicrobiales bacterium]
MDARRTTRTPTASPRPVRPMRPSRRFRSLRPVLVLLVALGLAGGCIGGGDGGGGSTTAQDEPAAPAGSDSGPCPQNVVIQTDWFPQVEHGGTYQLIGTGGRIDKDRFTYSGPLRNRYKGAHGVQTIEIRAGGAAVDSQSVTSLMYQDEDITLGFVNTDDAISASLDDEPVVGVVGSLDVNPQMLMWSPARLNITEFKDLGRSRVPVLHFPGMTYVDYLVAQGILTADQPDATYDGSPDRFIAAKGEVIQQGFATNEVYSYTDVLEGWKRPVDFFLIHWMGYENYPAMMTVRADRLAQQSECLKALVPTLQRAWVDFLADPAAVSAELITINDTFNTFFKLTPALNDRALQIFSEFELATNGADDTYGNFDTARVGRLFDIVSGVMKERGRALPATLSAEDVATNAFIDPAVSLPVATS